MGIFGPGARDGGVSDLGMVHGAEIPVRPSEADGRSKWLRIDYMGATTLILALVLLLLGLNSGGNTVSWTYPLVLTTLPLAAVALAVFVYVEHSIAVEPIIPVRLLLDRTVLSACLTNWFVSMAYFACLFYVPIYFQLLGMSATQAGVRLVPSSLGVCLGSVSVGLIMRSTGKYYVMNILVEGVFVLSLALVSTFTLTTPAWRPFIYLFLSGFGYSGMLTIMLLALIAAVDHNEHALVPSASYAFRSTGSTIGITVASVVFQNILNTQLWTRLGDRAGADVIIPRVRESLDAVKDLPWMYKADVEQIYMDALTATFRAILLMGVMGFVASLFLREHRLYSTLTRK